MTLLFSATAVSPTCLFLTTTTVTVSPISPLSRTLKDRGTLIMQAIATALGMPLISATAASIIGRCQPITTAMAWLICPSSRAVQASGITLCTARNPDFPAKVLRTRIDRRLYPRPPYYNDRFTSCGYNHCPKALLNGRFTVHSAPENHDDNIPCTG